MQDPRTFRIDFAEDVSRAVDGDDMSFESLYRTSFPYLEREASRFFEHPEDVEDALQETYLKIYEKLDSLQEPKAFLGWAITVCKRTCIDKKRRQAAREGKDDLWPSSSTEETDGVEVLPADEYRKDIDPGAHVDASHVTDVVRIVLEGLPDDQESCLLLWMEGYSSQEIAEELAMNRSTVRSNLAYARKKVEKILTRMAREGTFDYRELSTDPLAAFLYLLERYFGTARAVPPMGDSVLSALKPLLNTAGVLAAEGAIEAGLAGGGATVTGGAAAGSGGLIGAIKRIAKDPMTAVVAIVLAVALAIGIGVGIQAMTSQQPIAERDRLTTTRPAVDRVPETTEAPEETPAEAPGPGGEEEAAVTVPVPANTPGGGGGGTTTNNGNVIRTVADLIRSDGRLTTFQTENSPFAANVSDAQAADRSLFGSNGLIADRSEMVFSSAGDLRDSDGIIFSDLSVNNASKYTVRLNEFFYGLWKNTGENIAMGWFVPNTPTVLNSSDAVTYQLVFPEGYYQKANLPAKNSGMETQFNMVGTSEMYQVDYTITNAMNRFRGKEVRKPDENSFTWLTDRINRGPTLTLVKEELNGQDLDVYVSFYNPYSKDIRITRLEFFSLHTQQNEMLAEGRVTLNAPITVSGQGRAYAVITIPSGKYKDFNVENNTVYAQQGIIWELV